MSLTTDNSMLIKDGVFSCPSCNLNHNLGIIATHQLKRGQSLTFDCVCGVTLNLNRINVIIY